MNFKNFCLLILLQFGIIAIVASEKNEWGRLLKEEDSKLNEQLKAINKPPTKSFKIRNGDIVDCVEIYKQLAFDHPLLKNHTIQMRPESMPSKMFDKDSIKNTSTLAKLEKVKCPKGSVPIKRVTKVDLMVDKYLESLVSNYYTEAAMPDHRPYGAVLEFRGKNYGTSASLNSWSLHNVGRDQYSSAYMSIVNGVGADFDALKVGWIVFPTLFGDTDTRLFTYWLGELIYGTQIRGCYNIDCPGFVQVSSEVFLGSTIWPLSKYNDTQYQLDLNLYQDTKTGNWWLQSQDHNIGYWPRSVFHFLQEGAEHSAWGGEAGGPRTLGSAPMGSGHFPREGFRKSAFISNIKVRVQDNRLIDPAGGETYTSDPKCYDVKHFIDKKTLAHYILFGGPGNCK